MQQIKSYIKSLQPKQLRKISFYSFAFALYTYLPFLTFLAVCISYLSFELNCKKLLKEFKQTGLVGFLPASLQKILLNRSLFDILCDIWYSSKFSVILKALLKPFIHETNPEEAHLALNELPEETKEIIFQKGIIHTLPNDIRGALLPSTEDSQQNTQKKQLIMTPIKQKPYKKRTLHRPKSKKQFKEDQLPFQNKFSMPWTYIRSYQEDILSSESDFQESNHISIEQQIESEQGQKNIELVVRQQSGTEVQWDNLGTFYNSQNNIGERAPKTPFEKLIKIVDFVSKIVHFQNRSKKVLATNNKTLIKIFLASSAGLTIQSIISKRTRKFMVSSLVIVCYLGCIGVSTGTLGILIFKILNQNKKKKQ